MRGEFGGEIARVKAVKPIAPINFPRATGRVIAICRFTPALTRVFDIVPLSLRLSRGDSQETRKGFAIANNYARGVTRNTRER